MKIKLIYLALLCIGMNSLHASHRTQGIEMSYSRVGTDSFEILIRYIRVCDGPLTPPKAIAQCLSNTIHLDTMQLVSIKDLNYCQSGPCNGSGFYEERIFKGLLDLSNTSCCYWTVYTEPDFRDNGQLYHVRVQLNKCAPADGCHFVETPEFRLPYNQDVQMNYKAIADNPDDSISYSLSIARVGFASNMSYSGNFYYNRPLTFFGFPNQNLQTPAGFRIGQDGILRFRPTQLNQQATIVVQVGIWKRINGIMYSVGSICRDLEVIVEAAGINNAPEISNVSTTADTCRVYYCAGDSTPLIWSSMDQENDSTVFDVLQADSGLSWNQFYNRGKQAQMALYIPSVPGDTSSSLRKHISLRVRDRHCPIPSSKTYFIELIPAPKVDAEYTLEENCNLFTVIDSILATGWGMADTYWQLYDSQYNSINSGSQGFSEKLNDGYYKLAYQYGYQGGCSSDTLIDFQSQNNFKFQLIGDTLLCEKDTTRWELLDLGSKQIQSYTWTNLSQPTNPGIQSNGLMADLYPSSTGIIQVEVQDSAGCTMQHNQRLHVIPLPGYTLTDSTIVCSRDSVVLGPQFLSNFDSIVWDDGSRFSQRFISNPGWHPFILYNDGICSIRDSLYAAFNQAPLILTSSDTILCYGDTFLPVLRNVQGPVSYFVNGLPRSSPYITKYSQTMFWQVEASGCSSSKMIRLNVAQQPPLGGIPFNTDPLCPGDRLEVKLTNIPSRSTIIWDDSSTDYIRFLDKGFYEIYLTDSNGCFFTYPFSVSGRSGVDAAFGYNAGSVGISFYPDQFYGLHKWWFGDGDSIEDVQPTHQYAAPGNYAAIHLIQTTDSACSDTDTLNVFVSGFDHIDGMDVRVYPNPFIERFTVNNVSNQELRLFDLDGRAIPITQKYNDGAIEVIPLNPLVPGVYLLNFPEAGRSIKVIVGDR